MTSSPGPEPEPEPEPELESPGDRPRSRDGAGRCGTRGTVPVVSKALEVAIVLLYVGLTVTTLYAGVVPDYRGAAGDATAERVLTTVADRVEEAVPPRGTPGSVTISVTLPETIQGAGYRVVLEDGRLALTHPREGVGGRRALALPGRVQTTGGTWDDGTLVVRATSDGTAVAVELGEADP